jgi:hypothetical protein
MLTFFGFLTVKGVGYQPPDCFSPRTSAFKCLSFNLVSPQGVGLLADDRSADNTPIALTSKAS